MTITQAITLLEYHGYTVTAPKEQKKPALVAAPSRRKNTRRAGGRKASYPKSRSAR